MEIYSVKDCTTGTCELFASIPAIIEVLKAQDPIGNKYFVFDLEKAGEYDITVYNFDRLMDGVNTAAIYIDLDFQRLAITKEYIISKVHVCE